MTKLIMIVGTPGAGKTSVVNALSKRYSVFGLGSEMISVAKRLKVAKDRDELRYLDDKVTKKIRDMSIQKLKNVTKNTIIDTHASVRNRNNRYIPGVTIDEIKSFGGIRAIIYLDATASEILRRRKKDKSRKRDKDTVEDINEQRDMNLALMAVYSVLLKTPIYLVKNRENKLQSTIKQVENIAKETFG